MEFFKWWAIITSVILLICTVGFAMVMLSHVYPVLAYVLSSALVIGCFVGFLIWMEAF